MSLVRFDRAKADRLYRINSDALIESQKIEIAEYHSRQYQNGFAGQAPAIVGLAEIYSKQIKELAILRTESCIASIASGIEPLDKVKENMFGQLNGFINALFQHKQSDINGQLAILSPGKGASDSILNRFNARKAAVLNLCNTMLEEHFSTLGDDSTDNQGDPQLSEKFRNLHWHIKFGIFSGALTVAGVCFAIYSYYNPFEPLVVEHNINETEQVVDTSQVLAQPKPESIQDSNIVRKTLIPHRAYELFKGDLIVSVINSLDYANSSAKLRLNKGGIENTHEASLNIGEKISFHDYDILFLEVQYEYLSNNPRFKIERRKSTSTLPEG